MGYALGHLSFQSFANPGTVPPPFPLLSHQTSRPFQTCQTDMMARELGAWTCVARPRHSNACQGKGEERWSPGIFGPLCRQYIRTSISSIHYLFGFEQMSRLRGSFFWAPIMNLWLGFVASHRASPLPLFRASYVSLLVSEMQV